MFRYGSYLTWYTLRLRGRTAPLVFRTAVFPAASLGAGLSITGELSLPVCRGRAPCMGSVGSSQSSRCVFDKVCSSRISESGISGTYLYLSCEGIVISSSSVGVSNSTLPSSDMFLNHGEKFSSLCTPPCSAGAQSWSRAPKCRGPKQGGKKQKQLLVTV